MDDTFAAVEGVLRPGVIPLRLHLEDDLAIQLRVNKPLLLIGAHVFDVRDASHTCGTREG